MNKLEDMPVWSQRLSKARSEAGLTLSQVEAGTGINRTTVNGYEKGRRPTLGHGLLLEEFFGLDEGSLVERPRLPEKTHGD